MTILSRLAAYIVRAECSEADRRHISVHLMDTVTALIAGHFTVEGERLITKLHDKGSLVQDAKFGNSLLDNILLNCALTRLTEIDDIHIASCITPGSVIIPTAMTLFTSNTDLSQEEFANAILVGYEMIIRLGLTIRGAEMVYKGIWPTYFCAAFGAAAVSARLLQLSERETVHALSLALTLSTGGVSRSDTFPFRWFTLGFAAQSGCIAAHIAAKGFSGDPSMIDDDWFTRTYGIHADTTQLIDNLGESSMLHGVSLKPYCSAKQVIPCIEGFHRMLEKGIAIDDIKNIKLFVPAQFLSMINHSAANRISSLTSASYQLALTAYKPDGLYDINRTQLVDTAEMKLFMSKIQVYRDADLSALYPEKWAAKLEISTASGIIKTTVEESTGDPGMPLSEEQLIRKHHGFLDPFLGKEQAKEAVRMSADALSDKRVLLKLTGWIENLKSEIVSNWSRS